MSKKVHLNFIFVIGNLQHKKSSRTFGILKFNYIKRMIMRKLIAMIFIAALAGTCLSQPQREWVRTFNGASNNVDNILAMKIDRQSNVIVTGRSFASGSSYNISTVKYSASGAVQWTANYNGLVNGFDEAVAIATDDSGNVYVAGRTLTSFNNSDVIVIKYNSAGTIKWTYIWGGTAGLSDYAMSVHVDSSRNVYVAGGSRLTSSNIDYVTIKLNPNGGQSWIRFYGNPANLLDEALFVSTDIAGSVYVSGRSTSGSTGEDFLTVKYSSSGDSLWSKRYTSAGNLQNDVLKGFALDGSGNVHLTGSSMIDTNGTDYITIKYNSNGIEQWRKAYTSPGNAQDIPSGLTLDQQGNVIVTGASRINSAYNDIATVKYSSSGSQMWLGVYNNVGADLDDEGHSIAVDEFSNVYVSGKSTAEDGFNIDPVLLKYNSGGNSMWVARYDSTEDEETFQIGLDQNSNIYISGYINAVNPDYLTIKYSQSAGITLNLTMFIEGFYNEGTDQQVSDTVTVELRNSTSPFAIADQSTAVLSANGTVQLNFTGAANGNYYIAVKHRNSIETWSANAIAFSQIVPVNYNLSSSSSQAFGSNVIQIDSSPVRFAVYSGDVNQDGTVDATDISTIDNDASNFVGGYVVTDLTGDDFVDGTDFAIADNNAANFVGAIRP